MSYIPLVDGETPAHTAINQRLDTLAAAAATLGGGTGFMMLWAGANAPDGWLLCDGAAVSRSTYAALFAVIGTSFGAGDGVITFNLPDCRGRSLSGSGQGASLTNRVIGDTLGEETHLLTVGETPTHEHVQDNYVEGGSAAGTVGAGIPHFTGGQWEMTSDVGGNTPHNNMQPSIALNFIIKM